MKNTKIKNNENVANILEVNQICIFYQRRNKKFLAVDDLSFNIKKGEVFGLVGESGCGKTTTARSAIGLVPYATGSIKINGHVVNKTNLTRKIKKEFMAKNMQMIFQDPFSSLNPTKRVIDSVTEGFNNFNPFKKEGKKQSKIRKTKKRFFKKIGAVSDKNIERFENCVKQIVKITEEIDNIKKRLIPNIKLEIENEKASFKNKIKNLKNEKTVISIKYDQWLKIEKTKFNNNVEAAFKSGKYDEWKMKWETIESNQTTPLIQKVNSLKQTHTEIEKYYIKNEANAQQRYEEFIKILTQDLDPVLIEVNKKINEKHQLLDNLDNKKQLKTEQINTIIDKAIKNTKNEETKQELNKTRLQNINIIISRYKSTKRKLKHEIRKLVISSNKYINLNMNQFKKIHKSRQKELLKVRKLHQKPVNMYTEKIEKIRGNIKIEAQKNKINFIDEKIYEQIARSFEIKKENLKKHCFLLKENIKKDFSENKPLLKTNFKNKVINLIQQKNELLQQIKHLKEQINNIANTISAVITGNKKTFDKKLIKDLKTNFLLELKKIQDSQLINAKNNNVLNELKEKKAKLINKYITQLKSIDYFISVNEEMRISWKANFSKTAVKQKTIELAYETLKKVGLLPEHASRFTNELSGGQRQRIGIARAIIMNPSLLIADEPISALDVSIQAQVINILKDLKLTQNLSILLIAHDLRMVNYLCDRIAVVNEGKIVEMGQSNIIYHHSIHPYTKSLMSAVPSIDNVGKNIIPIEYVASKYEFDAIDRPKLRRIANEEHFVYGTKEEVLAWIHSLEERKE